MISNNMSSSLLPKALPSCPSRLQHRNYLTDIPSNCCHPIMLWENLSVKDTLRCGLMCLLSSLNGTWARCQKTRRSNANTSYPHRCVTAGHDPMLFHPLFARKQFFRPRFRSALLLMKASYFKVMC